MALHLRVSPPSHYRSCNICEKGEALLQTPPSSYFMRIFIAVLPIPLPTVYAPTKLSAVVTQPLTTSILYCFLVRPFSASAFASVKTCMIIPFVEVSHYRKCNICEVPSTGFEPVCPKARDFKSPASAIPPARLKYRKGEALFRLLLRDLLPDTTLDFTRPSLRVPACTDGVHELRCGGYHKSYDCHSCKRILFSLGLHIVEVHCLPFGRFLSL